jgi:predicted dithiol-disulfide oxidoreductase (DUF899 family)
MDAERRRLPVVKIEKEYVFKGPRAKATLLVVASPSLA